MRLTLFATGIATMVLLAGGALAATVHWAPAMPQIRLVAHDGSGAVRKSIMFIYGDEGSDPFRDGSLRRDQHVSFCHPDDEGTCTADAAVIGVRSGLRRTQSLQVRNFDGHGNPIIGGVTWNGSAYPREVRLSCDLRVKEVARSCRVEKIVT